MAMVLDAFASYLGDLLKQVAEEELGVMLGVSGEIDKMGVKLKDLKNLLADAERRRITDASVQEWVVQLKCAMYEATDILDLCQLKIMEQGSSTPDLGCCNPLLFCLRSPRFAREIGGRIKKLNQGLDDIKERSSAFSFLNLGSYEDRSMARPSADYRKTDPVLEQSGLVGEKIEEDTRALVEKLRNKTGTDSIMVFAIVGVGGIGKTTLAKKVFNDEAIQNGFNTKIWLSITKEFGEAELLKTAIVAAKGILPEGGTQVKSLLVQALERAIRNKKFFLVLDDMWGNTEWTNLLNAPFSHGAPGSRVLITTRHDNVARGMKAVHPYHHVDKLEPEDGWLLLKKQVLTNDESESEIDTLKDIGFKILAKCDGLPLAVKVIGGLLCQREKERHDWENVLNDAIWSVCQMPEELNSALYLSYEALSPCLRQCFLHFSLKPKNTVLAFVEFIGMWIGEGFVHGNSNRLEELGNEYYKQLISRNLIEPDSELPGQYYCSMHDVVRSFAQYMAKDEALVCHNEENPNSSLSSQRFLRLSIEVKEEEPGQFGWRSLKEQTSLRSIILIGNLKIQSGDSLSTFSSLRTLHIESTTFAPLIESLHQLKHLRYLAIQGCNDIESLPENIYKMRFLQYINVGDCENLVKIPDTIAMLGELRFLYLQGTCVYRMPKGLCALKNLRTLIGFPAHMDGDWCSLEDLGPLPNLHHAELDGLKNVRATSFATKARLCEKQLLFMALNCSRSACSDDGLIQDGVSEKDQRIIEEVFDELCPPPCIQNVFMGEYFGCRLPIWMVSTAIVTLSCLRILRFRRLFFCTQMPDVLCKLPCLDYLEVEIAPEIKHVGPEFVQANSLSQHPSSQNFVGFPRLQFMKLEKMGEWEKWEWEVNLEAMPALEELTINVCKLRCIPPGLAFHARSLRKLNIWRVYGLRSLEDFASVVELELYDNPVLTRLSNFPKLQKLEIFYCPKVELLQEMNALRRLWLRIFDSEKQLPLYLQTVNPSHLLLDRCSAELLASMSAGKSGPEWDKFSHIQHMEAYADDGEIEKKWHLTYTSKPYSIETNITMQVLTNDESESEIDTLKDIGFKILAKCDGLPLAVKVIGGLLCQREKERHDWENVLNDAIWSVSQMPEELNSALYLSYEALSPCLRQCFLHFSLKTKNTMLAFVEFIGMWIGEGFVHGNSNRLEELGNEYYKQLISRNLIEPDSESPGQYYCSMHDVVRSFAQFMARDEALVCHNGENLSSNQSSQRFLRLSIEVKEEEPDQFGWRSLQEQTSLRSIISIGNLKIQSGDSLSTFSSLRTLHIESTTLAPLIESLHQLKHLRYLAIQGCNDIKCLPENIHKMRFLQYISLYGCVNLVKIPDTITMLGELRVLWLTNTSVDTIPRGLCSLTNLRTLTGFPVHMDGDWCSLEDLGPLPNLQHAELDGLKNVCAASFATKARLCEKKHLLFMALHCSRSTCSDDGLIKDGVSEKDQRIIEEVFDELCPPPCIQNVFMGEYFGCRLPIWMVSTAIVTLSCLRILRFRRLFFCTQLPDVLCKLPCLDYLEVEIAPEIKHVGPEFVQPNNNSLSEHPSSQNFVAFPRLQSLLLEKMGEWEKWEWEENIQAMPALEELKINVCKLRCIPPGLAFHARSLRKLNIRSVYGLQSLEDFSSVIELKLYNNPVLTRVSNFPKLQKLEILYCPKVELLQEINALRRLWLRISEREKQLPLYLQSVNPCLLDRCSAELLASMSAGKSGPEWDKFSHIQHVEAYADDGEIEKKWNLTYTSKPYSIETNIAMQEFK